MFLLDCHNHTNNSLDAKAVLSEMCDAANEKGFGVYCITEHYDCEFPERDTCMGIIKNCYAQIDAYKASHPDGKTKILKGIELGQMLQDEGQAKRVLDAYKDEMDFVIGSLHNVSGMPDFYFFDYVGQGTAGVEAVMEQYYLELYEMSKAGGFDSVGHITYPYRYAIKRGVPVNLKRFDEIIRAMMKNLIEKGIAMEINTSGYRQGLNETMPGVYHMKMYRELGGEMLTIGSDAHAIEDHGKNIADGLLLAKECGFDYITYFEKRKPVMVKL